MTTCSGEICFNLSAIELKLYRQFRAGEAHILTLFDDCRIIMSGFRTVPGSRVTWGKAPRFGNDLSLTYLFVSTSEKSYMYVRNDMLCIY